MSYCTLTDIKDQLREDDIAQCTDDRVNLASGILSGNINSSVTSITLNDSTQFATSGRIQIDYEVIDYTANSGTVLSGCVRGSGGSLASSHLDDAVVTEKNCINTTVVTRAITDADAEIDGYCATQYEVPFVTTPVIIRKASVDISIYNLYSRRLGAPDDRTNRYKDTVKFLINVSNGVVTLGADSPAGDSDAGPGITTVKEDRIFSMGRYSDSSCGTLDRF